MRSSPVQIWFMCKFCKCLFKTTKQYYEHKRKDHFGEFQKVKCIVFEETSLTLNAALEQSSSTTESVTLNSSKPVVQIQKPNSTVGCDLLAATKLKRNGNQYSVRINPPPWFNESQPSNTAISDDAVVKVEQPDLDPDPDLSTRNNHDGQELQSQSLENESILRITPEPDLNIVKLEDDCCNSPEIFDLESFPGTPAADASMHSISKIENQTILSNNNIITSTSPNRYVLRKQRSSTEVLPLTNYNSEAEVSSDESDGCDFNNKSVQKKPPSAKMPKIARKPKVVPVPWKITKKCATLAEAKEYIKTDRPLMAYNMKNPLSDGYKVYYKCRMKKSEYQCNSVLTIEGWHGVPNVVICEAREHTCVSTKQLTLQHKEVIRDVLFTRRIPVPVKINLVLKERGLAELNARTITNYVYRLKNEMAQKNKTKPQELFGLTNDPHNQNQSHADEFSINELLGLPAMKRGRPRMNPIPAPSTTDPQISPGISEMPHLSPEIPHLYPVPSTAPLQMPLAQAEPPAPVQQAALAHLVPSGTPQQTQLTGPAPLPSTLLAHSAPLLAPPFTPVVEAQPEPAAVPVQIPALAQPDPFLTPQLFPISMALPQSQTSQSPIEQSEYRTQRRRGRPRKLQESIEGHSFQT